ncbi:hypothetical protein [Amycolatopsis sp. NBC_01480]|uniref:hypothetical protein n=1 Tax=Amycolatopsis sp. NBC_01480 TaxID=2903562 RepID=UPI002E2D25CC|nr:hypothetical protein [Amycolatopsis sp. NBC_01480]
MDVRRIRRPPQRQTRIQSRRRAKPASPDPANPSVSRDGSSVSAAVAWSASPGTAIPTTCAGQATTTAAGPTSTSATRRRFTSEDTILDAVAGFLADRVFGPERQSILADRLAGIDDHEAQERRAHSERIEQNLNDLAKKQNSVLQQAMDGDPADAFTKALRSRYNDLETQRVDLAAKLATVTQATSAEPDKPSSEDLSLLDSLPPTSPSTWPRHPRTCFGRSSR